MSSLLTINFQLQSGVDADARYDAVRGQISALFAPLITLTSKYVHLIGIDETPSCDRIGVEHFLTLKNTFFAITSRISKIPTQYIEPKDS